MLAICWRFNSRTPGGVRLLLKCAPYYISKFQFTHPGRGATSGDRACRAPGTVSIHAPREGCDIVHQVSLRMDKQFQFTHPGRGATGDRLLGDLVFDEFQFTHPGRGATRS